MNTQMNTQMNDSFQPETTVHIANLIGHSSKNFYDLVRPFFRKVGNVKDYQFYPSTLSGNIAFDNSEERDIFIEAYNEYIKKEKLPESIKAYIYEEKNPEDLKFGEILERRKARRSPTRGSPKRSSSRRLSPKRSSSRRLSPKRSPSRRSKEKDSKESCKKFALVKIYYTLELSDHDGYCSGGECEYSIKEKTYKTLVDDNLLDPCEGKQGYKIFIPKPEVNCGSGYCELSPECVHENLGIHAHRIKINRVKYL